MADTSKSFLDRLRDSPDDALWSRFVEIYTPMIRGWLRKHGQLQNEAADDLVQDVLIVVVRKIPQFHKEARTGSFRKWLRSVTVNCLRDRWRARKADGREPMDRMLDQLEDPDSALSRIWDEEHDRHVTKRLLEHIEPYFEAKTWAIFRQVTLEDVSAGDVALAFGVTENAVFIAKSRVLARLREEGRGMLD